MQNKKVYLAKSDLASGLDFEYVKSNLLRIPNIEIVEYGDGFQPFECTCLVYVSEPLACIEDLLLVNKNITNTVINAFQENLPAFLYIGNLDSPHLNDVEQTMPIMIEIVDVNINNEESWEAYGILDINCVRSAMLDDISYILDEGNSYLQNTRHYKPKKGYCMPDIPSVEQRRFRGTTRHINLYNEKEKSETYKECNIKEESSTGELREKYTNAKSRRKQEKLK